MSMISGFFMSNFHSKGFFCAVTGAKLPASCSIEPFITMVSVSISYAITAIKELALLDGGAVARFLGSPAPGAGPWASFVAQRD